MGIRLNRTGVAEHIGVALPTIDRYIKEGMPMVQKGGRGVEFVFDLADVIRWLGDRRAEAAAGSAPNDLDEIERRTAQAKLMQAELALAKAKGEVAPIHEFERAQAKAFAEIRANCMNIPQRVVVQLLGETDETVFKTKLRAEIILALTAAAEADLTLADDEEDDDSE